MSLEKQKIFEFFLEEIELSSAIFCHLKNFSIFGAKKVSFNCIIILKLFTTYPLRNIRINFHRNPNRRANKIKHFITAAKRQMSVTMLRCSWFFVLSSDDQFLFYMSSRFRVHSIAIQSVFQLFSSHKKRIKRQSFIFLINCFILWGVQFSNSLYNSHFKGCFFFW